MITVPLPLDRTAQSLLIEETLKVYCDFLNQYNDHPGDTQMIPSMFDVVVVVDELPFDSDYLLILRVDYGDEGGPQGLMVRYDTSPFPDRQLHISWMAQGFDTYTSIMYDSNEGGLKGLE